MWRHKNLYFDRLGEIGLSRPPRMSVTRGYFGIGSILPKTEANIGTLMRSAACFGAAYVFTVRRRYKKQASDTTKAWKRVPLFHYADIDQFFEAVPYDCVPVAVEIAPGSLKLPIVSHPERAVYLLGPEDGGIPVAVLKRCPLIIEIPTSACLNVAVAGSIVMYDRIAKARQ